MQVDPIKPTSQAPGTDRLILNPVELLLRFGFKFNLCRYSMAFQRGLERSGELMQTLADENEAMTQQFNAQAYALNTATEELERRDAEVAAQGMVVTALAAAGTIAYCPKP